MVIFEALPAIIVTILVIEGVSFFVPAVKNLLGVIGPILIVLGIMGWSLLGSSANLMIAGVIVIVARYVLFVYLVNQDRE